MITYYLSQFDKAIYDTNCIVYYRFNFQEKYKGKILSIFHPFHSKIDKLTSKILNEKWHIYTIKIAWEEIQNKGIAVIVEDLLKEKGLYTEIIARRLSQKLLNSLNDLKSKSWFIIEDFLPSDDRLDQVKQFYINLPDSSEKKRLIDKNRRPFPSYVDLSLIVYSKKIRGLLVSTDHDICDFKDELEKNNLCSKILPLWEIN